jgi:capsular exopolysaccharide synthesis family protein
MNTWDTVKPILLGIWRRRKGLVVLTFLVAVVSLGPLAFYMSKEPPRYRTSATILVESRPDRVPVFQEFAPSRPLGIQMAIFRSRAVAEAVLDSLPRTTLQDLLLHPYYVDYTRPFTDLYRRLTGEPPDVESPSQRALRELQQSRVSFWTDQNGIVTISSEASTAQAATDITNTYIDVLLSRTRAFNIDDTRTTREFLQNQVMEVGKTLATTDEALRKFTAAHGGIKVPAQNQAAVSRLSQTESALAEVEANRKMAQTRLEAMKAKAASERSAPPVQPVAAASAPSVPAPVVSPKLQQLRQQLTRLETGLLDLQTMYTDEHPRVTLMKDRIADVQHKITDAIKEARAVTPAVQTKPPEETKTSDEKSILEETLVLLETSVHSLSAQEEALRKQAADLRRTLGGLSRDEFEYSRLSREVDNRQALYGMLSERLAAARVREQGEMKVIKVIDAPPAPKRVASKKRLDFLAMALAAAVVAGVGLPAAVEWLRRAVETESDVEATGLPVLAMIPRIRSSPRFVTAAETDVKGRLTESFLFSEAFRHLRAAIQFAMRAERARTILVTSPYPTDGKSTVVVNLGMAFGEARWRVILADTDLQRPVLDRITAAERTGGFIEALHATDAHEVELSPMGEGMWLASRGTTLQPHTRSMLASERLGAIVEDMASRADIVLCDSSPVLLIPDGLFLAGAVDAVILVVNAGKTRVRDLAQAKAALESTGTRILGVVINNVPGSVMRRQYNRHYMPYMRSVTT